MKAALVSTGVILLACTVSVAYADSLPEATTQKPAEQVKDLPKADTAPNQTTTSTDGTPPAASTPPASQIGTPAGDQPAAQEVKPVAIPETPKATQPPSPPPKPATPADKPAPKGQDAAVKLYSQKKFSLAAKLFEKFIQDGSADVDTHAYLAYCLYNMRQYRAALKQFDWVAKYCTKKISLQMSAQRSASTIRCYMAGVCPGNCLKTNDPRWQHPSGLDPNKRWIKFSIPGGWSAISDSHLGQVVVVEHGEMVNKGTCPICGGTGSVAVLHDGDPVPR